MWGNRSGKAVDAVTTRFAHDGWNPGKPAAVGLENFDIWAVTDGVGSLTSRNIHGDGVDQPLGYIAGTTAYWYLQDHQNSVRKVLDNAAVVNAAAQIEGGTVGGQAGAVGASQALGLGT